MVAEAEILIDGYSNDTSGSARWITSKEAERHTSSNRAAERDNKRAGLNSYNNPVGATEIEDFNGC